MLKKQTMKLTILLSFILLCVVSVKGYVKAEANHTINEEGEYVFSTVSTSGLIEMSEAQIKIEPTVSGSYCLDGYYEECLRYWRWNMYNSDGTCHTAHATINDTYHWKMYTELEAGETYYLALYFDKNGDDNTETNVKINMEKVSKIGSCGPNVEYSWDETTGTITLTGTGTTWNEFESAVYQGKQWNHIIKRVVVGEGITRIGDGFFSNQPYIEEVVLPSTLKEIGRDTFGLGGPIDNDYEADDCNYEGGLLTSINLPEGLEVIDGSFGVGMQYQHPIVEFIFPHSLKIWDGGYNGFGSVARTVFIPKNLEMFDDKTDKKDMLEAFLTTLKMGDLKQVYGVKGSFVEDAVNAFNKELEEGTTFKEKSKVTFINVDVDPELKAEAVSTTEIKLTWNQVANASGYRVYSIEGQKQTLLKEVTDNTCTIESLQGKTSYNYIVNPVFTTPENNKIEGYGSASAVSATTLNTPEKGTIIEKADAKYKVTVAPSGEDKKGGTVSFIAATDQKVKEVIIPDKIMVDGTTYQVTSISDRAFIGSKVLTTVKMGAGIKTIGKNAFSGCNKLEKVTIGKNVTTIGDKAFYKCTALTKIILPSKVDKIGKSAFYGCKKLKTITIKTKKLTSKKVEKNAFKGVGSKYYKKVVVKVPGKKYVKKYKSLLQNKGLSKKAKVKK